MDSSGASLAGVVLGTAGIVVLVVVLFCCYEKYKQNRQENELMTTNGHHHSCGYFILVCICPTIKVNDMRVCIVMKTRRKKIMSIVFMFVMFGIVPLTNIYATYVHC